MGLQHVLPTIRTTLLGYLTAEFTSGVTVRDGGFVVDDRSDNALRGLVRAGGLVILIKEQASGLLPGGEVYRQLPDYGYRAICLGESGLIVETLQGRVMDAIGVRENLDLTASGTTLRIARIYPLGWTSDDIDPAVEVPRGDVLIAVEGIRMDLGIGGES